MQTYLKVMELLGWPHVYLVPPKQFEMVEGVKLYKKDPDGSSYTGCASEKEPIFTSHHGLRGKVLTNNLVHEIIHVVQPWRKHWEVECMAECVARGGGRGYYSIKYGHTVADVPPRDRTIKLLRAASQRFNRRQN